MQLTDYIKSNILFLDGAMGTLLQEKGLKAGECSESWNITNPEIITEIHKAYYDAGSNVISTNTFGINTLKYSKIECKQLIDAAVKNAVSAKNASQGKQNKYIAFDIGPLGKLLKPFGEISFEAAYEIFSETVKIASEYEIDLFIIETITDIYETKAALLAVKDNSDLPVFVTNAYGEDLRLMSGADAELMADFLASMGVDAFGVNCSFGPDMSLEIVRKMCETTDIPVILKPNAGMPEFIDGRTVYRLNPDDFAETVSLACDFGVSIVGGCCGTTPMYIKSLVEKLGNFSPKKRKVKVSTRVSSFSKVINFNDQPILIGERINPTGKKRFKQALFENDIDYIVNEGILQEDKGVHILDVNVGLAGIDEDTVLENVVKQLQCVTSLPLQLDSSSPYALERAMRIYNGKPLINSVNGKQDSMDAVFPLVKKYGGVVIALTLDENGIPDSCDGRVEIAIKIISEAKKYGIDKHNIIFDPLAMSVSTDCNSGKITLEAIKKIKQELGCKTSLGISNVSFGLPDRDKLNCTYFASALSNGLDCAIINPFSDRIMDTYFSYCALNGFDSNFQDYIEYCNKTKVIDVTDNSENVKSELRDYIIQGRKEKVAEIADKLLAEFSPLDIINNHIITALDEVGSKFERGNIYLPQLLMSAEAASVAFDMIKKSDVNTSQSKCDVILATVKGDIHDIGKNIVKLLLENFGFNVIDLGKDVPAEKILEAVQSNNVKLVGLSALMTTTLTAMQETVKILKENVSDCFVFVGGAVVNEEFANFSGADKYTCDALASVKYCDCIYSEYLS